MKLFVIFSIVIIALTSLASAAPPHDKPETDPYPYKSPAIA